MGLVQRITETVLLGPGSSTSAIAARSNTARVYLAFCLVPSAPTTTLSTRGSASNSNSLVLGISTFNVPRWELWRAVHGTLCTTEWWFTSNTMPGQTALVVLEVIEDDTGVQRSPGGVILSSPGSMFDGLPAGGPDRAAALRAAIQNAERTVPRGNP